MGGIPTVRTWRVTVRGESGPERWLVLEPTRRLALMNFRAGGNWCDLISLGIVRDQSRTGTVDGVRDEKGAK